MSKTILPPQTGAAGKFLKSDGTDASFEQITPTDISGLSDSVDGQIATHNTSETAHEDIRSQLNEFENWLPMENLVVNGDFIDGLTGWTSHGGASISISNDECKITTAVNPYGSAKQTISLESLTNKCYVHVKMRQLSGVPQKMLIQFGTVAFMYMPTISDDVIYALSTIFSGSPSTSVVLFIGKYTQPDIFDIYIDKVIVVDLTKTFGAGNEPTKLEMDELIELLGGWFDGEISVTQKQFAVWTLNMIRQNRNAIIALGGTII
jgi:hypothetical protein